MGPRQDEKDEVEELIESLACHAGLGKEVVA